MLPLPLSATVGKQLQRLINNYIWEYKRPRLPNILLQIPVNRGGTGLPNIVLYHKAALLEAAIKLHAPSHTFQWVDMENNYSPRSSVVDVLWTPRHLRDKNTPMLPTTRLTLQMWDYLHKRHTSTTKFSSWAPITTLHSISPWLSLHKWKDKGITHITDICQQGTILPFPDIQLKYTLPPNYIFPYLQLKSIIKEKDKQLLIILIMAARNLIACHWKQQICPTPQQLLHKTQQYLRHEMLITSTPSRRNITHNNWQRWSNYTTDSQIPG
ncbi:Hypothetical predicted protein [Pelobates cultripes]|uniref:Reverse transcriptase n=1 Tax=Pelobates cultripes TaxID=61616 RepID=A0AAD1TMD3_PELCU|nr:Hypothetical predicted protein [Pelobates cultripes]CAH2329713.1 Hypothetical predicted protein [Pelobates cultripes]